MKTIAVAIVLAALISRCREPTPATAAPAVPACRRWLRCPTGPGINGTARPRCSARRPSEHQRGWPTAARCWSTDAKLLCLKPTSNSTCRGDLAEPASAVPHPRPPAASALNLAALTIGLAALGALLLHRRRRPGIIGMEDQP